ncbi:GNAT family N-acetyltransferase [Polycladomyces sp. WAk]|uniref:GNAT family N-acetyltransferase n=1 Tax=Polycladomyces zharkentensis TaxID=2807616 RepID=A0ABS2WKZ9_9BACL|nr:GNAT family N-acetyltransferase [Polycladomyces sp. WAk]MBN2910131.1 GNAT family N-acetyltransferase [Polycladomyces sp. WAk]
MVKPLFAGERVRLSPLADSDLDVIAQWYADGQWIRMLSAFEVPMTRERLEQWANRYRNDEKSFLFGVRTKDDNRLVGTVTLEDILWNHGTGWLSISVGPKHRGNGYGEEALRLILDFAFDECNLHRVQLTVFAYNVLLSRCTRNLDFNGKDVTANSCIVMVVATICGFTGCYAESGRTAKRTTADFFMEFHKK